ncbi:facilitated trehalose transporter Tret1-like [Vanessa atalanta]|uniref:facilitated trehalose transporter Tret1-like n=1 Tax=Vanessa atalanta TaxID=42275 RepID=UPI001FCD1C4C|nr:facilitated trehalose transporter Tret1-like [Vanessa atalanta]XP_047537723.1 facilitated trehalose transporter Tret1-like [Vanessa atalanta]XP_047537724.1 facilitated trehalose transporter Tret1-like [Vanessa atalanta]XP_047537725.1 facilitated trehalose transporter Tret1-like [Vanessa atalanta]XP_047537726.1 facilitated trehalose transporter Tret1-like [Vanessa atalanta]
MTTESKKIISRSRVALSQFLACLALNVLLIGLGMSISFVTMVLPDVLDAKEGLSLNKKQASWFGSMAFLCQPLGSVFSGPLLDYFGRKKALFLVNIPHLIAWLLLYFAWDVPSLFLGNALLGIGTGIMEAPSVTYVGEISDSSLRGTLTTLTNTFTSTGMFIAYLLGTVVSWRQAALLSLTVPLATMVLVLFVPETPIWLLSKGRQKEALQSLCRLRGWAKPADVQEEFNELLQYNDNITKCVVCNTEGKPDVLQCEHASYNVFKKLVMKFKYVLFVKETLRPFKLVMAYFFFHTMSGLLPVRPNMVNVCKALGMKFDSKIIVVVVALVFIIMNLLSVVIVKTIGKRKLILSSLFATACCSLALSVYAGSKLPSEVFSYEASTFPEQTEILPVILFMMLVMFTSLGIPWILLSEMFPFRSRGMATGLAAALSYVIFFLGSKTNYNLEANFHMHGTFAIYAIIGFIGAIFLYFFLPETERKTLVEIEAFYKGNQKIFADDFFINAFRKNKAEDKCVNRPMLVN